MVKIECGFFPTLSVSYGARNANQCQETPTAHDTFIASIQSSSGADTFRQNKTSTMLNCIRSPSRRFSSLGHAVCRQCRLSLCEYYVEVGGVLLDSETHIYGRPQIKL